MKKTPNGRTYPRAKDIYINYENSDQRRRDAAIRHDENTKRTLKEFTSRPDIQEKQKNAKDTKALTEKRYQELKPMISNMKSSLFNEIIEFTKTHSVDEAIRHFSAKIKEYKTLHDEYDEIEEEYEKIDDKTYLISGSMPIYDVNKILGSNIPEGDYDTLSGYLQEELGRIPLEEENPVIETKELTFKIEEYEDKRILKVKVCKNEEV